MSKKFRTFAPSNNKKEKIMWFWIFIIVCAAIMGHDIWTDTEFQEKLKNVEE